MCEYSHIISYCVVKGTNIFMSDFDLAIVDTLQTAFLTLVTKTFCEL